MIINEISYERRDYESVDEWRFEETVKVNLELSRDL